MDRSANNLTLKQNIFSLIGFVAIGIFSFLYSIYHRDFAEIHVQIPGLPFPIFVGELLLAGCLLLLWGHFKVNSIRWNKWHTAILIYLVWIALRTLHGYAAYGPLALRNAALFYYALFAVFGYYFYDPRYFNQATLVILTGAMFLALIPIHYGVLSYTRLAYLFLFLLLIFKIKNHWIKGAFFLLLLATFPFINIIQAPRTLIIAFIAAILITVFLFMSFLRKSPAFKFSVLLVCLAVFFVVFVKFGEKQRVVSFTKFNDFKKIYDEQMALIVEREKDFTFRPIEPKVYSIEKKGISEVNVEFGIETLNEVNREILSEDQGAKVAAANHQAQTSSGPQPADQSPSASADQQALAEQNIQEEKIRIDQHDDEELIREGITQFKDEIVALIQKYEDERSRTGRPVDDIRKDAFTEAEALKAEYKERIASQVLGIDLNTFKIEDIDEKKQVFVDRFLKSLDSNLKSIYNLGINRTFENTVARTEYAEHANVLFRIFIWQDMIEELKGGNFLLGINFGKPQRSKKIEMLQMAKEEWLRDGWITPHNSWLHMVYRGGIVGAAVVMVFICLLISAARFFVRERSVAGILLVGAVLNWAIMANALVILELPYNAVSFWSLFGMMLAFRQQLTVKKTHNLSSQAYA